jgi:hypothetical protein
MVLDERQRRSGDTSAQPFSSRGLIGLMRMVRSSKEFSKNPWIWAGFLLHALLGSSWVFDLGVSYGSFRSTRWYVVFGLASGSVLGVFLIAFVVQRSLQIPWLRMRTRLGARTRLLGLGAGVVAYAITFLFALFLIGLVFFQLVGLANPDMPLPIWADAIVVGLLISTSNILGSQLPFTDHAVPDYEPVM